MVFIYNNVFDCQKCYCIPSQHPVFPLLASQSNLMLQRLTTANIVHAKHPQY